MCGQWAGPGGHTASGRGGRGFGKCPEVAFHALLLFPAVLVGQMLRGPCGTRRRPLGGPRHSFLWPFLLGPDSADILASLWDACPGGQADPEGGDLLTAGPNPTRGALCGGRRWVRSLRCPGNPCPCLAGRPCSGGPPLHQPARVTGGWPLNLFQFIFSAPHPWSYTTTLPARECGGVLKNYLPLALI